MRALPLVPLRVKKGVESGVRAGTPWVFASDIIESSELMLRPLGSLVQVETHKGERVGTGYYNSKSQIACRILTLVNEPIDEAFFASKLQAALRLRERIVDVPYYRLVHSEADGLPGLLIDRFGGVLVVQVGTAGMEALQPLWMPALQALLKPCTVILRNDAAARALEGLANTVEVLGEAVPPMLEVRENGATYFSDLAHGQKTGWFFDQRDNRRMIAALAPGKSLIDIYSHSGGFGVLAAKYGAAEVVMVDSSKLALDLARKAVIANALATPCEMLQGDAFAVMQQLNAQGRQFDIVLADPPAFVKTKKDIASGMKGYEKVARLAATLGKPGGLLFVASCSHHAGRSAFNKSVIDGVRKAGYKPVVIKQTGAGADHPKHPALRESEYLKGILLRLEQ